MSNLSQDNIFTAEPSDLSKRFKDSVFEGDVKQWFANEVKSQLTSGEVGIPTLQWLIRNLPPQISNKFVNDLKGEYVGKLQQVGIDTTNGVSPAVQIAQGALLDSMLFVWDKVKEEVTLATLNPDLLAKIAAKTPSWKAVMQGNGNGISRAYRIDVSYAGNEIAYKATQARDYDIDDAKDDYDGTKRFFLVPYQFIEAFILSIAEALDRGEVIMVSQTVGGMKKVRYITRREDVLKECCDDPSAVMTDARYFIDKGFFYAPVIGASSMTAMVTNIDIFKIDSVRFLGSTVTGTELLSRGLVQKPESPIRDLIGESVVIRKMAEWYRAGDNHFDQVLDAMSYSKKLVKDKEEVNLSSIAKYMHSVPAASRERLYNLCGVSQEVGNITRLFSTMSIHQMSPNEDLEQQLKNGVCRIIIQKDKDCTLSSIFCTNNTGILSRIYGAEYARYYESFAYQFYSFYNWLKKFGYLPDDGAIAAQLRESGLIAEPEDVEMVRNLYNGKRDLENLEGTLKAYFASRLQVDLKRSEASSNANTTSISVRTLTGYLDDSGKSHDYLRYIDKSKIVKVVAFDIG